MKAQRRKFTPEFKSKVAIEALRERETLEVICKKYDLHPSQVHQWKKELQANCSQLFTGSSKSVDEDQSKLVDELYKQIGQLKVANDFLKKKLQ